MGWARARQGPWLWTDGTHLWSDDETRLHEFAKRIGLRRRYFQDHRIPHYDLTTGRMRVRALKAGAVLVSRRELVRVAGRYAGAADMGVGE